MKERNKERILIERMKERKKKREKERKKERKIPANCRVDQLLVYHDLSSLQLSLSKVRQMNIVDSQR
jgi:hypothetical protein